MNKHELDRAMDDLVYYGGVIESMNDPRLRPLSEDNSRFLYHAYNRVAELKQKIVEKLEN